MGVACQLLVIPLLHLVIQWVTGHLDVSGPARELTDRADGAAFVVLGLLVVLVAPVIEEAFTGSRLADSDVLPPAGRVPGTGGPSGYDPRGASAGVLQPAGWYTREVGSPRSSPA